LTELDHGLHAVAMRPRSLYNKQYRARFVLLSSALFTVNFGIKHPTLASMVTIVGHQIVCFGSAASAVSYRRIYWPFEISISKSATLVIGQLTRDIPRAEQICTTARRKWMVNLSVDGKWSMDTSEPYEMLLIHPGRVAGGNL